jgi:hypothetical protein
MSNSWIRFVRAFYASERAKDSSKCHNRVSIRQVAKVYNCKKKMSTRKTRKSDKFSQMNPMHLKSHRKTMSKR